MRRRGGQGAAAEALDGLLAGLDRNGTGARIRESLAIAYWPQVVGPQAAEATEAENVRDGVLFVRTRSSVWSHELTFLKSRIIAELNRRIGRVAIREVVFRAHGVRKAPVEAESAVGPTEEELAAVPLSPADQAALDGELASLSGIADPRLRNALIRRMARDRRLRRWRLDHGWRSCERCTALHTGPEPLCPVCRVCR